MRRKHRRLHTEPDLDITPFMNLMIVLVPVLLLKDQQEELQIQVIVYEDQLVVAANQGGVIKSIPRADGEYNFVVLKDVMKELKSRVPEKKDIIIMPSTRTSYQTLVTVMDTVRSYEAVVAGSVVDAELFPEISLGDAPVQAVTDGGVSS